MLIIILVNKTDFFHYWAFLKQELNMDKQYALKKEENTSLTDSNLFMISKG